MGKIKNWLPEGFFYKKDVSHKKADFKLVYENIEIGLLSFEKGYWIFRYSEEFKNQKGLLPIVDFPELDKVYKSEKLWPFFISRIPSLATPYVKKKIEKKNIDKDSLIEMLKQFGEKTISSPFKLIFTPVP